MPVDDRIPEAPGHGAAQSESSGDSSDSLLPLQRRARLYERTWGIAVGPVLLRRAAIVLARKASRKPGHRAHGEGEVIARDPRRWVEAGPRDRGSFMMFLDPHSAGHGANQMALGTYDETLMAALRTHSLESGVIWDVGAHIGYESLCFATVVGPAGRIVAFEPNPANVREWQRNVSGNAELAPRLSIQAVALCDRSGTAAFRFSEDVADGRSSGSHLAGVMPPEEAASYAGFDLANVACARVDDLVEAGDIAPPTLIKIDVEGAEADVLRGAIRTLQRHRPILLVEVHHVRAMHDVDEILRDAEYATTLLDSPEDSASRCFLEGVPAEPRG